MAIDNKPLRKFPAMIIVIGLLWSLTASAQDKQTTDRLVAKLGKGFVSNTAKVNGTTLHYVRGGNGPAIILLHGFPADWYAYHQVMPLLAKKFTVVAVDLRGVGGSSATQGGYESPNMAEDIRQLMHQLKLEQVYVVGHDIGGMVAYAFARLYPKETRGVMILDVPLPGIDPWEESIAGPGFWHIPFHQTPNLPEQFLAGRQAVYIRYILDSDGLMLNLTMRPRTRSRIICVQDWGCIALFQRTGSSMQRSVVRLTCPWYGPRAKNLFLGKLVPALQKIYGHMGAET
jgi:pimeloyl-ACP methyl ester carboxylesterase